MTMRSREDDELLTRASPFLAHCVPAVLSLAANCVRVLPHHMAAQSRPSPAAA